MQSLKQSESTNLLWERFQSIRAKQRVPHALLLTGVQQKVLNDFAYKVASAILCSEQQKPCGKCKSCRLIHLQEHPDLNYLSVDKEGGVIKIDQIRELQQLVFTSAQLTNGRVVIINPADKMNTAAANALLKLLEEPPTFVHFLLIAQQLSSLPATIISRCQQWRFSSSEQVGADYLTIGQAYSSDTERGILFGKLATIIEEFIQFMTNRLSVCALADKWLTHDFSLLMWLIYLINAQLIDYKLNISQIEKSWTKTLMGLAQHFEVVHLFRQLNEINGIMRKLQRNINMNQSLVLENLLLGYKLNK
ncbi:DNA polymerase III subunit delta' [Legionella nautarum]|uniref:DNA polymerase III subunit delta' n=1 Tax=Legionella nautarum TaxID=45070 RepID=A0A0W0WVE0_9GAMM|nr:DNA polymerase III subunit delta' C-terminal domain-containing protein [Legionella nautarum]KTD36271.1 DNA polymerase III subunit delta' [Legionella nautarum]